MAAKERPHRAITRRGAGSNNISRVSLFYLVKTTRIIALIIMRNMLATRTRIKHSLSLCRSETNRSIIRFFCFIHFWFFSFLYFQTSKISFQVDRQAWNRDLWWFIRHDTQCRILRASMLQLKPRRRHRLLFGYDFRDSSINDSLNDEDKINGFR